MHDFLNPPRPAGPYDYLLARDLPTAKAQRLWAPTGGRLPALFVSHGLPPTLDNASWLQELFAWGQSMQTPRHRGGLGALGERATGHHQPGRRHPAVLRLRAGSPNCS
ncbi:MAG TPA: hypothetical protein VNV66_13330 [Pilimelia sp.]|nr:hypothetical protein [Pilimelia sp.]